MFVNGHARHNQYMWNKQKFQKKLSTLHPLQLFSSSRNCDVQLPHQAFAIECEWDNWRAILLPVTLFHGHSRLRRGQGFSPLQWPVTRRKTNFSRANKKWQLILYRRTARPSIDVRTSINVRTSNGGQTWPETTTTWVLVQCWLCPWKHVFVIRSQ